MSTKIDTKLLIKSPVEAMKLVGITVSQDDIAWIGEIFNGQIEKTINAKVDELANKIKNVNKYIALIIRENAVVIVLIFKHSVSIVEKLAKMIGVAFTITTVRKHPLQGLFYKDNSILKIFL